MLRETTTRHWAREECDVLGGGCVGESSEVCSELLFGDDAMLRYGGIGDWR